MQVNILEAKNRLSQLIKSVQAGEVVVIANRGEPVARLVPAGETSAASAGPGSARAILCPTMRAALPRRSMPQSRRKDIRGSDLPRCVPADLSHRTPCPLGWTG